VEYVPIFEGRQTRLRGGARVIDDPWVLHKRAVRLQRTGDGITTVVRGRQAGVVVRRTPTSGVVEITVGRRTVTADTSFEHTTSGVIEVDLPLPAIPLPLSIRLVNNEGLGREVSILGVYSSDVRATELPSRLGERVQAEGLEPPPLCQLTDPFKWYEPAWRAAMDALQACPPYEPPDFIHRKAWEWVHTLYGLSQLGMLSRDKRGLGVGVGWEPLSYFLANHVDHVVATDLYAVDDQWSTSGAREGDPVILEDPDKFAPYPYDKARVDFKRMDGRHLEFPDESFDFIWSCSSIEHFGGHPGAAEAMQEVERVLRPQGVAAVITEFVLPEPSPGTVLPFDAEYFNLRCLYHYLLKPVPHLWLVEPLDLSIPRYYVDRAVKIPGESGAPHDVQKPHVVLRTESGVLITSVAIFLRKHG